MAILDKHKILETNATLLLVFSFLATSTAVLMFGTATITLALVAIVRRSASSGWAA